MKPSFLSIGLLSIATLSTLAAFSTPQASAQCHMNDTNIQLSMNGSRKSTDRTNDVSQSSSGNCVGNSVNTTNVQVQTGGTDRATQRRVSNQQLNGGGNNPTGVNLPPVKTRQNIQIDVDNPADRFNK
jgi:Tfp pilus assembly protein PilV